MSKTAGAGWFAQFGHFSYIAYAHLTRCSQEYLTLQPIWKGRPLPAVVDNLSPKALWGHFGKISEIPRPSKNEGRIAAHVLDLAKKAGLEVDQDPTGNIVVRKPGSAGRESAPTVVIQSHLDMVCEKNRDVQHDFDKDPIQLERANGDVKAKGTTLGSDNGIGVASALAIMMDPEIEHGPLEFLFTVDEETGMTGAMGLKPDFLKGRIMLNLDSEEEGSLYVGCAGGRDTILTFPLESQDPPEELLALRLDLRGLRGGHSGVEIHLGRGNALKILGRILREVGKNCDFQLGSITGGSKRNAIPREAEAMLYIQPSDEPRVRELIGALTEDIRSEYSSVDPGLETELTPADRGKAYSKTDQDRIVSFLHAVPHGVTVMSPDIPGLVETSTNLATVSSNPDSVEVATSQRSSVKSSLNNILDQVAMLGKMSGASSTSTDGYPGWKPNMKSRALQVSKESYKELFGKEPEIKAIHAGLECGLIGERFPGMDMISFGPTITGAHSPDERVDIASVQKFWDLLLLVLKNLSN